MSRQQGRNPGFYGFSDEELVLLKNGLEQSLHQSPFRFDDISRQLLIDTRSELEYRQTPKTQDGYSR